MDSVRTGAAAVVPDGTRTLDCRAPDCAGSTLRDASALPVLAWTGMKMLSLADDDCGSAPAAVGRATEAARTVLFLKVGNGADEAGRNPAP